MTGTWWTCKTCTQDGCERRHYSRGLCEAHYVAARRNGTIDQYELPRPSNLDRLMRKVDTPAPTPAGPGWGPSVAVATERPTSVAADATSG